jgi:hypothetical protein
VAAFSNQLAGLVCAFHDFIIWSVFKDRAYYFPGLAGVNLYTVFVYIDMRIKQVYTFNPPHLTLPFSQIRSSVLGRVGLEILSGKVGGRINTAAIQHLDPPSAGH